ncbi:hypothetical protein ID866_5268 [Astraeus odoratus]|nr:hypothetical protein ID866_5268 [Astraeus odoratus]
MLGLDPSFYNGSEVGGGVIQTTASDCALVAVVAARSWYTKQYPEVPTDRLLIYTTTQTHSLGKKAGLVLGLNVRALEVTFEDNFALRGDTLRCAIEEDRAAGLHPFILVGTVGTTSSGAVDRLDEVGLVLACYPSIWLHVDAAWAGMAMVCPEYRESCLLGAINKYGDSFCVNFHKTIKHNETFVSLIRESADFNLVAPPSLALSVFRLESSSDASLSLEKLNELNRLFYGRVSSRNNIALTQTDLNGVFCIRFAVGAERTSEEHIRYAYEILSQEAQTTLREWKASGREA